MEHKMRPRIAEDIWESQKSTIHRLYIVENKPLTACGGLIDIMSGSHGFSASKSQYETQLKKWGFRTYSKGTVLDKPTVSDHDLSVQGEEINFNPSSRPVQLVRRRQGVQRPLKKRKKTDQNPNTSSQNRHSRTITLPMQRTPALQQDRLFSPLLSIPATRFNIFPPLSSPELPIRVSPIFHESQARSFMHNASGVNTFPDLFNESDVSWTNLANSTYGFKSPEAAYASWLSKPSDILESLPDCLNVEELAYTDMALSVATPSLLERTTQDFYSIPDFSTSIIQVLKKMLPVTGPNFPSNWLSKDIVVDFRAEKFCYPHQSQLLRKQSIDIQAFHMVLHRLIDDERAVSALKDPQSNADRLLQAGVEYVFTLGSQLLGKLIYQTPYPYNAALQERLFCAAIEMGAYRTIEVMHSRGFDHDRKFNFGYGKYYPLEYSCRILSVEVSRVLLESGANPNKISPYHLRVHVIQSRQEKVVAAKQILGLLSKYGMMINPEAAQYIFGDCEPEMLLAMAVPAFSHVFESMILSGGLARVLNLPLLDNSWLPKIKNILEHDYSDHVRKSNEWNKAMTLSLSAAALRGRMDAITLLLAAGARPSVDCFVNAVESNNLEVFRRFLDLDLDPNARNSFDRHRSDFDKFHSLVPKGEHTVLSRCTELKFTEAFQMLQERGFLEKAGKNADSFRLLLIAATKVGDEMLVQYLLSLQDAQLPADTWKVIDSAVIEGQTNIVKQLLSAGFKPSHTSLFWAVKNQNSELVELLVDIVRICQRCRDDPLEDIIFEAVKWGDLEILHTMIRAGAPLNNLVPLDLQDHIRWPPDEDDKILERFEPWNATPLATAILRGYHEVADLLFSSGAQLNVYDSHMDDDQLYFPPMTVLTACVLNNDHAGLSELLYRGADPFDNEAILMATALGNIEIVKLLLHAFTERYSSGVRTYGSQALFWAIKTSNMEMLQVLARFTDASGMVDLMDMGEDSDEDHESSDIQRSPLAHAMRMSYANDRWEGTEPLLTQTKDLDAVTATNYVSGKMTPLLYAINLGSLTLVRILIESGANKSLPARLGVKRTPLQAAVEQGSEEIVRYLLEQGVDPNEPPAAQAGATSLQLAAMKGFIGLASILLDAKADVNAKPAMFDGRTAFEGAAEHGHLETMLLLFRHGADLLANDQQQFRRACRFAEKNGQHVAKELCEKLLQAALNHEQAAISEAEVTGVPEMSAFDFFNFDEF